MRVYFLHERYNWESFSVVRTTHEELERRQNIELLNDVDRLGQGDYLWIFSSRMTLAQQDHEGLKRRGVKIIIFGHSDPGFFSKQRLDVCDMYCTNDKRILDKYGRYFNMYLFPCGCDIKYHVPLDIPKTNDVFFAGSLKHNWIPERAEYIPRLREERFKKELYGKGIGRFITGQELIEAYNRAHLNLDISNEKVSPAARVYEAGACGVPTLTYEREDTAERLEPEQEVLFYKGNYEQMVKRIKDLLENKDKLSEVGFNAMEKCAAEYDIQVRIDKLLEHLGEN